MEGVQDKIAQLKSLLEDINSQLAPWLKNSSKTDKQVQLDAVVKLSEKFDKIDTDLPNEIRSLKFKLIQEIDKFKEAEKLNQELTNVLSPFFKQKNFKSVTPKSSNSAPVTNKKHFGIKVIDLLQNNIIQPNTKIYKKLNNQHYEALILANGTIKLVHNNNTTFHKSLSLAAREIVERPINGWTWWEIEDGFERKILDYYRQKLIRNGK